MEGRRKKYAAAKRAQAAAAKNLEERYAEAARALLGVVSEIAEADALIEQANADLPEGEAQIPLVEAIARALPNRPEKVIAEKIVERWMPAGARFVPYAPAWLTDEQAKQIERTGPSTGRIANSSGLVQRYELRRFKVIDFLEAETSPSVYGSIAGSIRMGDVLAEGVAP